MNRASIPHTKTFTGCWTCRSRHVKCDEQRPECGPCQKRKVPCEGYGVRLVWNPDEKGISRPSLNELRHEPTTILGARQLAAAIGGLDEVVFEAHDSYRNGPFSVFNINYQAKRCRSQPTIVSTPANNPPGSSSDQQDIVVPSPDHRGDISSFRTTSTPHWNEASAASTERIQLPPPDSNTLQHTTRRPLHPRPPPFLNPNPLPPRDTVLVHHWVTFVCANSVLVDSATNFFRTIYTPLAVSHTGHAASAPQAAVYHALCAAAAYSRARVCPLSTSSPSASSSWATDDETTTATRHETAAVRLLQHSLDPAAAAAMCASVSQKEAVLAAIILLTLVDIIRGTTAGAWRAHMRGGRSWIEALGGAAGWEGNDADGGSLASSVLYQQFRGGAVVASLQDSEGADDYSPDGGGDGVAGGEAAYHLDLLYGVPKDMFEVLVRLRKVCAEPGRLTEEEKEAFEMRLYLSVPSLDAFPVHRFGGEVSRMVHLHTAHLFYYAMLIHFKRRVRRVPPAELQDLVSKCVEHLEAVEEMPQHALGVTITWPCLVVACEAEDILLRERLAIWLQKKKRHGFGIIDVAANVVVEVWRRREAHESPGDIHWMDVLGEVDSDILLC